MSPNRSRHPKIFCKKGALKNFAKFTRKHLCRNLFFNKDAGLRPAFLFKRDSDTGVFLWILRNFQEHIFYWTPPVTASVFTSRDVERKLPIQIDLQTSSKGRKYIESMVQNICLGERQKSVKCNFGLFIVS